MKTFPSSSHGRVFGDPDDAAQQLQFMASSFRFDPDGFRNDRPLRRKPFYSEPYLTCMHCNSLYFLDMVQIRYVDALIAHEMSERNMDSLSATPVLLPSNDNLKPCEKCRRLDGFVAGAKDFTQDIERTARYLPETSLQFIVFI